MSKKIVQIVPVDGVYNVVEKMYIGYGSQSREVRQRVVAWALVEDENTSRWVEPLILGPQGLVLMAPDSDWRIEKL